MKKRIVSVAAVILLLLSGCSVKPSVKPVSGTADIDLTSYSSTMVYTEVYNMVNKPTEYLGKVIRLRGQFNATFYDETQKYYYYVLVADATSCCKEGLEFIVSGKTDYPEDYPANGDEIEITGVFSTYKELDIDYYYISTNEVSRV